MPRGNPSPKLTITVDPEVHKEILAAAAREGVSVSAWITNMASDALRREKGLAAVAEWEAERGEITEEEMVEARRRVIEQLLAPRKTRRSA